MGSIPPTRDHQKVYRYILCIEIATSGDVQVPDHFELLYRSDSHYDGIMALSGGLSTVRQSLQNAYYHCTDVMIE